MSVFQNIRFLRAFNRFTNSLEKDESFMNWLMSIISLATAAATIFAPQLQHLVSAHPAIFAGIAGAVATVNHILPSPTGAAVVVETGEKGKAIEVK